MRTGSEVAIFEAERRERERSRSLDPGHELTFLEAPLESRDASDFVATEIGQA